MQPGEAGQRAAAIVDLFQNALIYTTVLRNIDVRIRTHTPATFFPQSNAH
tara:strand:+ start:10689 stop:10838 length:150 start_codon:yes stop_codon:yes gene_type:complete